MTSSKELLFVFRKGALFVSSGISVLNPFPNDNILDSSKLKEFADDTFKFDEMTESSLKG